MPHRLDRPTVAQQSARKSLLAVDDLLGFAKDGKGKPSSKERALFAAAVVFIYGIWENFVEQLAIELTKTVSDEISPERVPGLVRIPLEKKSAWELTVTPGWRALWLAHVTLQAVGDEDERFGLNTAKANQSKQLLSLAGVQDP